MNLTIEKSNINGHVVVPSSKSYTLRGLICAAMAGGETEIISPLASDDTDAALDVLRNLGISVKQEGDVWRVNGGNFKPTGQDLNCRDSGVTFRFMVAIAAVIPGKHKLVPSAGLAKRPIAPLTEALGQLGVKLGTAPDGAITVEGGTLEGGGARIVGNISSQFISALLLVAPRAKKPVKIHVTTTLESKPFAGMTVEYLEKFGIKVSVSEDYREFSIAQQQYRPARFRIEGDWTSASYPLALGALLGEVEAENLNPASLQGDRMILEFLRQMGARININGDTITTGKGRLKAGRLKAISADFADVTDLLPTMGVLAACAEGVSEFTGIARTRLKESNRVTSLKEGLTRMGIKVIEEENRLLITGGTPRGAGIETFNDHRNAMAFSIPGALAGNTTINGAECVAKTYPEYWEVVESIGMRMNKNE
jgi:3-phosphoshikimate 1-carboxyvinyltransferase